ncbi:hypothetical protein V2J09_014393 [Rumex salicifolius]
MQRPNRNFHRRGGDGRNTGGSAGKGDNSMPSHSQQQVDYRPEFNSQNPAPYVQFPPQTYQYNPYFQNPNYPLQDPNLLLQQIASLIQYPNNVASSSNVDYSQAANFPTQMPPPEQNLNPPAQNYSSSNVGYSQAAQFPTQTPHLKQKPNPPAQNQSPKFHSQFQHQQRNSTPSRSETLKKIEVAVEQARGELIASAKNVSTWKVIESVLLKLKVDSWDSLGFQLQQVPSLHRLIVIEGKINAFIHCFVAVRTITSLYDLQVAICENEGIGNFEELELGPLVRHPLIEHYFSSKDMTEVYNIKGEKIISLLKFYICKQKAGKSIDGIHFLKYVAERCKVRSWEKMGLRIQSLGTHIKFVREALRQDNAVKKAFFDKEKDSGKKAKKRPLFSLEKKLIDERYDAISQRVASFSSAHKDFLGKHIRFNSSSSGEDDDHDDYGSDNDEDGSQRENDCNKQQESLPSSQDTRNHIVSSCPYPSAAEEMTRLGLRRESNSSSPATHMSKENDEPVKKKRKVVKPICRGKQKRKISEFITTWKEACRQHTASEVFNKMLEFYGTSPHQKKRFRGFVSTYPFWGLLNVAVMSIKNGSWDSIYDTFQLFDELGSADTKSNKCIEYETLDVELGGNDLPSSTNHIPECGFQVTVEDISRKVAEYFANESSLSLDRKSALEKITMLGKKLRQCEVWLNQQFSVKNFDSLGYGDLLTFIEKNISKLPKGLHDNLNSHVHEHFPFEVSLLQDQLAVLLSQAFDSLWEGGAITKNRIANLLSRQFPSITFSVVEEGCTDEFPHNLKNKTSNCILFSATLLGMSNSSESVDTNGNRLLDCTVLGAETGRKMQNAGSSTPKEALEVLLGAPMLVDLNSWLHWDVVYAPSLGPLVSWLLTEVNVKDLLCLLTRDSKIIRINSLASPKSFYKALLQGSSFQIAVELLSLFALSGGGKRVPSLLLKDHARQAFEVLLTDTMDGPSQDWSSLDNSGSSGLTPGISICMKHNDVKECTSHASRLVLDCLGHLPSEFCSLAADILLSGLKSVVKCAPSSVLLQCKSTEERLMLHEIGFALGIVEWIDDHHKVCPIIVDQSCMHIPALPTGSLCSRLVGIGNQQQVSAKMLLPQEVPSVREGVQHYDKADLSSSNITVRDDIQGEAQFGEMKDAALVVESIRREEFGLVSDVESSMLKKQHSRLGRALHCLSQELYSQDSHFLLELIQNADDNAYHEDQEPTLMFILQNNRIVVLNNEKGFTDQNIRALCDVGNSTKKGSSAGYIGQKGIGFKSVFRVTDAPEIHSNGFHIKFDITEGQIGFVLPTIVPPFSIDFIRHLGSAYPDQKGSDCWNTCMVLPFRSRLTQGIEMTKIISMFSDIHPSLLLFLHRLQCIKLINMLDNSYFAMKKEIVGDGLVKVSYGENRMTWFITSKKLYAESIRPGVQSTEISIAFTLKELENGKYEPHLEQQPVFAFLPLRTYGLKFILQGDFVLPSSREEVDGDSSWNQWLLTEVPELFVSTEKLFCSLPCFRENAGKAVAAYMHFVPLVGEVQGFFYGLPRMIISRLRQSECLLEEGCEKLWVPPCKVLRSWNEHARVLMPDMLLHKHLGLGFLDKDIILSDSLARALGIQDYGPKVLLMFLSSICYAQNGLDSMGLSWLSLCINELYVMLNSPVKSTENTGFEMDLISSLKKIPFLPLSDGTYSSTDEGTIWLNVDSIKTGADGDTDTNAFPKLYASLRIISPSLFSAIADGASCVDDNLVNNVASMLQKIGVQHLTAHEIIKAHILPIVSDDKIASKDTSLFIECYAFVMIHFQSSCTDCHIEREHIISELQSKAIILTNHGFKRLREVAIHFGKDFGNSIDVSRFTSGIGFEWHEIDDLYLKHPLTGSTSCGFTKWREFFHNLGVTDFVKVLQTERNLSDIPSVIFQQVKWDRDLISSGILVKDWESRELDFIISSLATNGSHESSRYLLEVLDTLWDNHFSDRTVCYFSCKAGENMSFKSSLMNNICDVRWVTSSMETVLQYPRDLFYDCDAVRSILGNSAPYVIPKIRSSKLVTDIGLKTHVTLDDILASLQRWRLLNPFKASVSQMSRLYSYVSKELVTSKERVMEALSSGPFIFVPCTTGVNQDDVATGLLLSPGDVYWHDQSGTLSGVRKLYSETPGFPTGKLLCDLYPGLHDFFVNVCGVDETPPFRCYLQILKQISTSTLPLEAAGAVFQVFLRWSDGIKCGAMVDDDIVYLRDHLLMPEFAVLPALQDKWVSLHSSFGLVCWVDDDSLKKQFKHSDNIEFLHFGKLTIEENEMLQTKVSVLLQKLGIPALSQVVAREAIYDGLSNSSFKASLVSWALPLAQRYIYTVHAEKYTQLKLSGFEKLQSLKIVVVEKLFYRNVIKKCGASTKKRSECSCLLQDNVLYTKLESDTHSLFMELSRLFFDGVPELPLANFLHMLTTMAESGSTEEQMEFFILNSQKMPKIPDDEPVWSLSSPQASEENDQPLQTDAIPTSTNEPISSDSKNKKESLCWPPAGWKTAPGFDYGYLSRGWSEVDTSEKEINEDYVIGEDILLETSSFSNDLITPEVSSVFKDHPDSNPEQAQYHNKPIVVPNNVVIESHCPEDNYSKPTETVLNPDAQKAVYAGRLGEYVAFTHLKEKHGTMLVRWMNEQNESGLPYDIAIGDQETGKEFIEVKATRYASKNWFKMSTREWQFAVEKGDRYSLAHVILSNTDNAKITIYQNPVKLCQQGKLELSVMVPRQYPSLPSVAPQ